jgi:hypothetical protein
MLTNTKIYVQGLKLVLDQRRGHEMFRVTVIFSVLSDGRKRLPFVILRGKNLPEEKLHS